MNARSIACTVGLLGLALALWNTQPVALAASRHYESVGYDIADDFSATNNPNGPWSFGWSSSLRSGFHCYKTRRSTGALEILSTAEQNDPCAVHNSSDDPGTYANITWPARQVSLHPGPGREYSHARFTVSADGTYTIRAEFAGLDRGNGGTSTDVHILINGHELFSSQIRGYNDVHSCRSLNAIHLESGDIIDFAVGDGGNGNTCDTTGLDAHITHL